MEFGSSFLMLFFSALLGGGSVDLADMVGPDLYWQHAVGDRPTNAVLISYAAPPQDPDAKAPDITGLIDQLGADSYQARQAAAGEILAHGAPVAPQLKQAMQHDDPEVALRAEKLHARLTGKTDGWPLKRLMAVRTLGEAKVKQALPALKKLTDHDNPFLAEAARQAVANITGRPYQRPTVSDKDLAADLALLPADCNIVGQLRGGHAPGPTLETMLQKSMMPGRDIAQHRARAAEEVIELIGRTGNLRFDAATLGVKGNPDNGGAVVIVARGLCDHDALHAFLSDKGRDKTEVDGTTIYSQVDVDLALLSPRRLIAVVAEKRKTRDSAVRAALDAANAQAPAAKLGDKIDTLLKSVDRKAADLWVVAEIDNTIYQRTPITGPFNTMVLTGARDDAGKTRLQLRAAGDDPAKVAAAVKQFEAGRKKMLDQMQKMAKMMPPIAEFRETIAAMKVEQPDGKPRVNVQLELDDASPVMMMPMLLMSARDEHAREAVGEVQREPAQPVEAAPARE